jgi:uncharacterized repeat protein (TIGR01451 family)
MYIVVSVLLIGVALSGPSAWATPGQSPNNQTVPTRTPESQPQPEPSDSESDEPTVQPTATIEPAQLALEKRADRNQVWTGLTVNYTLTLTNPGSGSAQGILIEDVLPSGLEPGEILEGSGAVWNQRTLNAEVAVLPPGGKYTVVFSALVGPVPGQTSVLRNRATASAAGGIAAEAESVLALVPLELPTTGGTWAAAGRP